MHNEVPLTLSTFRGQARIQFFVGHEPGQLRQVMAGTKRKTTARPDVALFQALAVLEEEKLNMSHIESQARLAVSHTFAPAHSRNHHSQLRKWASTECSLTSSSRPVMCL
jgi:hypothetical protein